MHVQVCHRMNLNFMTVPSAGHPKARWHTMIEPTLNRAVNGFLHRLEAAFRVLDKSNSGFISKSASAACISASGSNLGQDMDVFFDDDVVRNATLLSLCVPGVLVKAPFMLSPQGNVMLAFDELKSLVVSFFLQHYRALIGVCVVKRGWLCCERMCVAMTCSPKPTR